MIAELQLPEEILEIKNKSKRINAIAKRIDHQRKEWQIWHSYDRSYALTTDLYIWRNELNGLLPEKVIAYIKQTPGVYDMTHINLGAIKSEDESKVTVTFKYGFPIVAEGQRIDVDFETEGIVALMDKEVVSPKIEIIGKDIQPVLHLPENWTFLIAHPTKSMHMRTHGYVKWQPELLDTPRRIKIPDDLEMTFTLHNPDNAKTYKETEVLPYDQFHRS